MNQRHVVGGFDVDMMFLRPELMVVDDQQWFQTCWDLALDDDGVVNTDWSENHSRRSHVRVNKDPSEDPEGENEAFSVIHGCIV
jgi:hypothetical protein